MNLDKSRLTLGALAAVILLAGLVWFEPAKAYTDSQVAQAYRNCVNWLGYPAATKSKISKREGISVAQFNKSCLYLKKLGVKGSIAENHRVHAPRRSSRRSGGDETDSGPRSCSFGLQCSGGEQCLDGKCIDRLRQDCATSGLFQCPSDQKCVSGTCQ